MPRHSACHRRLMVRSTLSGCNSGGKVSALFRTQTWGTNFSVILNTSGGPVLNSAQRRAPCVRRRARSRANLPWLQVCPLFSPSCQSLVSKSAKFCVRTFCVRTSVCDATTAEQRCRERSAVGTRRAHFQWRHLDGQRRFCMDADTRAERPTTGGFLGR
eukprot:SAG31_NODE_4648_length_3069_cov_1.952525_3_plen_159_part_00